jgi:hypothetical protein
MKGWRLAGVIVFALFALMELGDFAGLLPGFSEPGRSQYAALLGISSQAEGLRLGILSVLSLGIVISAIAVVLGLLRRTRWTARAILLTAGLFWVYGGYQLGVAATQLSKNQEGVAIAGGVYFCIGVLAAWLGRKAAFGK